MAELQALGQESWTEEFQKTSQISFVFGNQSAELYLTNIVIPMVIPNRLLNPYDLAEIWLIFNTGKIDKKLNIC